MKWLNINVEYLSLTKYNVQYLITNVITSIFYMAGWLVSGKTHHLDYSVLTTHPVSDDEVEWI